MPLDGELMAVLSIGTPIGLGTYWAWVNRDRPARATTIGIWVALTGALGGALLGFNATAGLMAVITTIVGAAAGANLSLIALDVARIGRAAGDRSAHRHSSGRTLTHGIRSRRARGGVVVAATCSADVRARSAV